MDHFFTIDKPAVAEFKDRGSTFIAYAFHIETTIDFKGNLKELKKINPKAAHHCFAYRIGFDGNNFRVSDDGEPAGTAGKIILAQIDSRKLTNILVVVVRYFGGTLLGIPGLINAYRTASVLALQLTPIVQKQVEVNYKLTFDYTNLNNVMVITKQFNCTVIKQEIQLFCSITVGISKRSLMEVLNAFKELPGVEIATEI